jgi:hypothetical protein
MGLIKTILGTIFSLISRVGSAIGGVLGLGNKSGYFMELLDDGDETPSPEPSKAPEATTTQNGSTAKASDKPQETLAQSEKSAAAPASTQKAQKAKPASTVPDPDKPLVTAKLPTQEKASEPAIKNFATDYLVNPRLDRSPRRRPGPSLSPFKDMAKKVGKSPSMG